MQSWKIASAAIVREASCLISMPPAAAAPMMAGRRGEEADRGSNPAAGDRAISSLASRIPLSRLAPSPYACTARTTERAQLSSAGLPPGALIGGAIANSRAQSQRCGRLLRATIPLV